MYGKTDILSVQISETKHAIQLKFWTRSLFLEHQVIYLKINSGQSEVLPKLGGFWKAPILSIARVFYLRDKLVQYICIGDCDIKDEPKNVLVHLVWWFGANTIILAKLISSVYSTHMSVLKNNRLRTRNFSARSIFVPSLHSYSCRGLCICWQHGHWPVVLPNGDYQTARLTNFWLNVLLQPFLGKGL